MNRQLIFQPILLAAGLFVLLLGGNREVSAFTGVESTESSQAVVDEIQQFKLGDGSLIAVDYEAKQISVQVGPSGPKLHEDFKEDDFGGIFWDWGQIVPQLDGTWLYEDWLNEGFKGEAIPVE